jgi:tetratricopeptide (TPR) repeat protein
MGRSGFDRSVLFAGVLLVLGLTPTFGQKGGAGGGSATGGGTAVSTPTRNPSPTTPQSLPRSTSTNSPGSLSGPIFVSGRVVTDDGSPLNMNVRIERVCGGAVRLEGHIDNSGHFSFQLGQGAALDVDASTDMSSMSGIRGSGMDRSSPGLGDMGGSSMGRPSGRMDLMGCELRASMNGYHSDTVSLAGRQMLDNPDVGTIVLHRMGKVEGTTTSLTTMAAPKQAKKAYEKGLQLAAKGKTEDAEKHLLEATDAYPQYAIAWFSLGEIAAKASRFDDARKDFEQAIKADSHYVSPYDRMAFISGMQQKWQEAADYSKRAIEMNSVEFPSSFWYNAIANYNLKHPADAEKSARALVKLDTQHHFPGAEKMLAQLMIEQGNLMEAAVHVKAYLLVAPNAADAGPMRSLLTKVEASSATPSQQ